MRSPVGAPGPLKQYRKEANEANDQKQHVFRYIVGGFASVPPRRFIWISGGSWAVLGRSSKVFGASWAVLGGPGVVLADLGGVLGESRANLGRVLGGLGEFLDGSWVVFWGVLGCLCSFLERPELDFRSKLRHSISDSLSQSILILFW